MVAVSTSGNTIVVGSHKSLHNFGILKWFKVNIRPSRAPNIVEVVWHPPQRGWVKLNCDGASISSLGLSACGGLAKDFNGSFLGAFASFLGISNSLIDEFTDAMLAIEFANENN